MVNIYLMRHGETEANRSKLVQGWTDSPLTETGVLEIQEVGQSLSDVKFDAAFSSDSGRATQTAKLVLSAKGQEDLEVKIDKRLREWALGSFEMKKTSRLGWALVPRAYVRTRLRRPTFEETAEVLHSADKTGETESWLEIKDRIMAAMTEIANSGAEQILVVSHGFAIATFLSIVKSEPKASFDMKNGQVFKFSYANREFKLID